MAPTTLPQMLSFRHGESQKCILRTFIILGTSGRHIRLEPNRVGTALTQHDHADTPCGFVGLPKTVRSDEKEVEQRNDREATRAKGPDVGHNAGKGQGQEEGL